jgi:hypothetical protein
LRLGEDERPVGGGSEDGGAKEETNESHLDLRLPDIAGLRLRYQGEEITAEKRGRPRG